MTRFDTRPFDSDSNSASLAPREPSASSPRLASLDQFRGYTVLGMFLVNFIGSFAVVPAVFKHHNTYCSYADTIMPQFFFAAGFAYRLSFVRRAASGDRMRLYWRFVRRSLGLALIGVALYLGEPIYRALRNPPGDLPALVGGWLGRELFQTLVHIAATTLWILPVIGSRGTVRAGFAVVSAALHVGISLAFYYYWVTGSPGPDGVPTRPTGIDGGPLGFLSWTVPMLAGAAAYDCVAGSTRALAVRRIALGGCALMLVGYGMACLNRVPLLNESLVLTEPVAKEGNALSLFVEPPLAPPAQPKSTFNYWTMSQRAGSLSYMTFSAGLSAALYAAFLALCDGWGLQSSVLRTFGSNALAGYVFHGMLADLVQPAIPRGASPVAVVGLTTMFLACCYVVVRALERRNIYLRM